MSSPLCGSLGGCVGALSGLLGWLHDAIHDVHHAIRVSIARLDSDQDPPSAQGVEIPLRIIR